MCIIGFGGTENVPGASMFIIIGKWSEKNAKGRFSKVKLKFSVYSIAMSNMSGRWLCPSG